ncbi:uncharacterized protein LOC100879262 isoform X2 [Megachile rotundata]|uniref:uncharacterized protein LOC100879262 isoform X2 n=1 Tax=Megachile rotundata TaxID=143995 RepID=UPI000615142A|nr:PREDICTED: uncharacterized protein LOC100879262 isoform X2 [Megachile rotundata]
MHKRKIKQNTIKTPENLPKLKNYKVHENESNDFQLPSLQQKKKAWKDVDENGSTWDQTSTITCTSYSSEIENLTTKKVLQQWEGVENTLYEDGEQVTQTAVLEECIQWRTQIPHLRIVGRNPFLATKTKCGDFNINSNFDFQNEEAVSEHSLQLKERKSSCKHKSRKTHQDEIFNILYEYVISELFPNKESETDLLCDDFNDALQIRMAPVHSSKSVVKSANLNWFEETISLENRFPNSRCKVLEDHSTLIQKETPRTNIQEIQKRYNNDRIKSELDIIEDKLSRPHTSRNKLGTVFNEKIVVSPVPYVLSTRESFSTVKTTPIKFMAQSLNVSSFQGKNSTLSKTSNYQSTWHNSVSSAMWPKNVKLAPLDTSRFSNSKNRSLTSSSVTSLRNRRPLSPISRSTLPVSAQTTHNNNEGLEIQGKHMTPGQSLKLSIPGTIRDNNPGSSKSKRKKNHLKLKS